MTVANIGAKFTLDDQSAATFSRIRGGFDSVTGKMAHVRSEFYSFIKGMASTAMGFQLSGGISDLKELGQEIVQSAVEAQKQEKAITGVMMATDKAGKSFSELKDEAHDVRERLVEIGTETGTLTADMVEGFEDIAARSSMSTEEIVKFTEKAAQAGKVIPGGMAGIVQGFQYMEMGMIRARNPVVMMIAQAGLLQGNAREVAKQLQKMAPEEALKLGQKAIDRMATKMKDMPMGAAAAGKALQNIKESIFESVGTPLLSAFMKEFLPALTAVRNTFKNNKQSIEEFGAALGAQVGVLVKDAVKKFREGAEWVQQNADKIGSAITTAFADAKAVFQWILDHKEAIALAIGVKMAGDAITTAISVGKGIAGVAAPVASGAAGLAKSAVSAGAPSLLGVAGTAAGGSTVAATAATAGAAAAAVGAWLIAADQWSEWMKESKGHWLSSASTISKYDDQESRLAKAREMVADPTNRDTEALEKLRMRMVQVADDIGNASEKARIEAEMLKLAKEQAAKAAEMQPFDIFSKGMKEAQAKFAQEASATGPEATGVSGQTAAWVTEEARSFMEALNAAAANHQTAAVQYAVSMLTNSKSMQDAMMEGSSQIGDGFDTMIQTIATYAPELAKQMKAVRDAAGHPAGGKPTTTTPPALRLGGPTTINIKQDFRDQDPDRVALVFQRDIVKATEHRRQAKLGQAFGW